MTTGSGKPPSSPGRAAADTPNRLVVRSSDSGAGNADTAMGATDTAVALDGKRSFSATAAGPTPHAGMSALAITDLVGTTLSGKFLIKRKVGQGGMGAVYEATHTQLGRKFAVKVLLEKYAQREGLVKRLQQEAQLASSVGNEHIIDITDIGTTEDNRTYIVMEFLDGESMAECLARDTRLPEQRILRIVSQAASALAAAHAKGIVHRDIKPENLFLLKRKEQDFVKVVDFGISKSLRATGDEEEQPRLTQTGMVLGTPLYMSPEQARGDDELDARVDIYALGVIMYEAATGSVPFIGNNYLSVISQVLNETPRSVRELRPELSEEFEAIVLRAMAKNKHDRYASANDLLVDLTAVLDDPTHSTERAKITGPRKKIPKKPASRYVIWVGGVAVIIAAVAFTVKMMMGSSPKAAVPDDAKAVAPPPVDSPTPVQIDAPDLPKDEVLDFDVVTVPVGASITKDGVDQDGLTPMPIKLVKSNRPVKLVARKAGYDDKEVTVNPLEQNKTIKITLQKAQGAPKVVPRNPPTPGSGTGAGTGSGTRVEGWGGYPGGGGGSGSGKK